MGAMNRRRPLQVALTACIALALLPAAADAARQRPLKPSAPYLTDRQGRVVILHGVNVVYKVPPYLPNDAQGEKTSFNGRDARRLRSYGFNTIRLGVSWKAVEPVRSAAAGAGASGQARAAFDRGYISSLAAVVRVATRQRLYVLIDMHQDYWAEKFGGNGAPDFAVLDDGLPFTPAPSFPYSYLEPALGRAFTNFYANKQGIRDAYVAMWKQVATRFRGDPYVLGYDLMNEPSCEIGAGSCALPPPPRASVDLLQPLYDSLIPALRKADPTHPAFYEDLLTDAYGYPGGIGSDPARPFRHRGTVLSHHVYCGQPLNTKPCPVQEEDAFKLRAREAAKTKAALLLTEFGATDDLAILRRITAMADTYRQGWQYWQYKQYFDPTTISQTTEALVRDDGTAKQGKLEVLARAYPSRIAGKPGSWSFDPDTGVFRLSYRTRRGVKGETEIELPLAVHYPRGYKVKVKGGKATSKRGSAQLTIAARRGARKVSATVTPR